MFLLEQLEYHIEYWRARHCTEHLLAVQCGQMIKDMHGTTRMVANWLDTPLTEKWVQMVVHRCSEGCMTEHVAKFDDSKAARLANKLGSTNAETLHFTPAAKVRADNVKCSELDQEGKEYYDHMWNTMVKPETGLNRYEECATALTATNNNQ